MLLDGPTAGEGLLPTSPPVAQGLHPAEERGAESQNRENAVPGQGDSGSETPMPGHAWRPQSPSHQRSAVQWPVWRCLRLTEWWPAWRCLRLTEWWKHAAFPSTALSAPTWPPTFSHPHNLCPASSAPGHHHACLGQTTGRVGFRASVSCPRSCAGRSSPGVQCQPLPARPLDPFLRLSHTLPLLLCISDFVLLGFFKPLDVRLKIVLTGVEAVRTQLGFCPVLHPMQNHSL